MGIISLITDLGNDSPYIGVSRARLMNYFPGSDILDHSHQVEQGDLNQAAFLLRMLRVHCQPGTIHVLAVDAEKRMQNPQILLGTGFGQHFVSYNHGLLSLILSPEQTFLNMGSYSGDHNNMIGTLAPDLSRIADSSYRESLEVLPKSELVVKHNIAPVISGNQLVGQVVHIDRRGNLYTNISRHDFAQFGPDASVLIRLSRHEHVDRIVEHGASVEPGETACYFSEIGLLVIAIARGHASQLLGIRKHGSIIIEHQI